MNVYSHDIPVARPPAKIIPLFRDRWLLNDSPQPGAQIEHARHFLKVTLPAIPVAVFTMAFLICYFVSASDATKSGHTIDPTPAIIGSVTITTIVSALCMSIYQGFRHVAGLRND